LPGPARSQHLGDHRLLRRRSQAQVDEARAGDLHRLHPALHRGATRKQVDEFLRERARVLLQRLGQLHRRRAGEVAVRGLLGRLESRRRGQRRREFAQRLAERTEQRVLDCDHRRILRLGCRAAATADWAAMAPLFCSPTPAQR